MNFGPSSLKKNLFLMLVFCHVFIIITNCAIFWEKMNIMNMKKCSKRQMLNGNLRWKLCQFQFDSVISHWDFFHLYFPAWDRNFWKSRLPFWLLIKFPIVGNLLFFGCERRPNCECFFLFFWKINKKPQTLAILIQLLQMFEVLLSVVEHIVTLKSVYF